MSENLSFRKLCSDDIEIVGNLLENNNRLEIVSFFNPFPMSKETAAKILDISKKDLFFGVFFSERLVGMSMLRGFDERFIIPSFGIFIDFQYQKRGFGRKLTEWTLNWASDHNIRQIRLGVYNDNEIAFRLYKSLGFVEIDRFNDKCGRLRIIMSKMI